MALIGLAILGWQLFKERQNNAAAVEFTNATELYQAEKYREALTAFEKVQSYRWSRTPAWPIFISQSHIALGELDKAVSSGQRAVTASQANTLYRQLALMALATPRSKRTTAAKLSSLTPKREKSPQLSKTKHYSVKQGVWKSGDVAGALAAYKEYVKDQPSSIISAKVAELENKAPAKPAAK